MEHVLTIGRPMNGVTMFIRHGFAHPRSHRVESPQDAIVGKGSLPVYKRMRVVETDGANRDALHMCDDSARKNPGRCPAEVFAVISRSGLPLDLRGVIAIRRHAPSVCVTDAGLILTTLHHEGILYVEEGAFDFSWLSRPKSV